MKPSNSIFGKDYQIHGFEQGYLIETTIIERLTTKLAVLNTCLTGSLSLIEIDGSSACVVGVVVSHAKWHYLLECMRMQVSDTTEHE
jgi:hypothetical protein